MEIYYGKSGSHGGRKAYYVFPYTSRMKEVFGYIREVGKKTRQSIDSYYFVPVLAKDAELFLQPVEDGKKKIAVIRKERK